MFLVILVLLTIFRHLLMCSRSKLKPEYIKCEDSFKHFVVCSSALSVMVSQYTQYIKGRIEKSSIAFRSLNYCRCYRASYIASMSIYIRFFLRTLIFYRKCYNNSNSNESPVAAGSFSPYLSCTSSSSSSSTCV